MFKPMLACNVSDLDKIKFPVYCSPKIDGIRCLVIGGKVLSRSLKPIPNKFIQSQMANFIVDVDGELFIRGMTCNQISSAVMSEDGEPDFVYCVFDHISDKPYSERVPSGYYPRRFQFVPKVLVHNAEQILELEKQYLEEGYEGLIIRAEDGPYKNGRSTEKEGYLMKLKRFEDSEAIILDFLPERKNNNTQVINELGNKKRSSHKANKEIKETCGILLAKDIHTGVEFRVSAGLTQELKKELWDNQNKYRDKLIKYKFMPSLKEKPRHPTFLGFRDERDL